MNRLRELAGDDALVFRTNFTSSTTPEPTFLSSDVVFGNVPAHWFEEKSSVRWVQLESVGFGEYRHLDRICKDPGFTLTNLAGFFADPVAQTALAGILALYRGMDDFSQMRTQKSWIGSSHRRSLHNLSHSNVLLIGYGSINRRVEELLTPFHCNISTFRRSDSLAHLDQQLAEADIVICTLPETDNTINLFEVSRLSLLKPSSLFVNCGRGSVVDETALASALNNRTLAGAVLDVTDNEPLPEDHPFWTTPNTILSQHTAGGTNDEMDQKIEAFAENLKHYRLGNAMNNCVDFERGY